MKRKIMAGAALVALGATAVVWSARSGGAAALPEMQAARPDTATFAGGCFWCVEEAFDAVPGVTATVSGYIGGTVSNPTYEMVSAGGTGHAEAVQVVFDPSRVRYEQLLDVFWRNIDPLTPDAQFCDKGAQYRSAIFYKGDTQRKLAVASKERLAASKRFTKPIVTEIAPAGPFYAAEDYHQDYYEKNPVRYKFYKWNCGRAQRLKELWGEPTKVTSVSALQVASAGWTPVGFTKPSDDELKRRLTNMQYKVTQKDGTEPPFKNEYWDNHEDGIYVDIVSGEPLFSSLDKYESGTGWPSFTQPLAPENIETRSDRAFFMKRTEVRSKHADSHLGHVFDDGPQPTGLRYCMNSAAMRFVPVSRLEGEGYGRFLALFEKRASNK